MSHEFLSANANCKSSWKSVRKSLSKVKETECKSLWLCFLSRIPYQFSLAVICLDCGCPCFDSISSVTSGWLIRKSWRRWDSNPDQRNESFTVWSLNHYATEPTDYKNNRRANLSNWQKLALFFFFVNRFFRVFDQTLRQWVVVIWSAQLLQRTMSSWGLEPGTLGRNHLTVWNS